MKAIYTLITVMALVVALPGCGDKKDEQTKVEAPAGMMTLDLSKYGKPFTIFVPDSTLGKLEITEQSWGALEIRVGKNFALSITEDPGDIELRKSDIKADDVNKFKAFVVEEPNTIMWESEITKPEFHFYTIQKLGNSTYVFEDIKSSEAEPFSKESIQKMLDSAKNMKEVKKAEAA
jgi:hypothetical protein